MPRFNPTTSRRILKIAIVLLTFGPPVVEFALHNLEATTESQSTWARIFQSPFWYQRIVRAGNRRVRDHYVRLVTLVPGVEPDDIFDNSCRQRLFMARLIKNIARSQPGMIVIDKFYSRHSCEDPADIGNKEFTEALRSLRIPVILGLRTTGAAELEKIRPLSAVERSALEKAPLVLEPRMDFQFGPNVKYGLLRTDVDTRKIPLAWGVYDSREELNNGTPPRMVPTLARVAVEDYDAYAIEQPVMRSLVSRNVFPFTSLLAEREIPTFSAVDWVCSPGQPKREDWEHCSNRDRQEPFFKNRVILIGNRTTDDFHASVIGIVPGVVLQANYIESLLDDRYLIPLPFWSTLLINVVLLAAIGWLFYLTIFSEQLSPEKALGGSFLLIIFGWILIYLAVVHVGYYFVVWFPGGVALIAMWAHERRDKLLRQEEEAEQKKQENTNDKKKDHEKSTPAASGS